MSWPLPNRRETLAFLGSAAAFGTFGRFARAHPRLASVERGADPTELAERFRRCARGQVLDEAASAIRAGAGFHTLLTAVFLAGIQDLRPRPVGSKLHAVMVVESAFQLAEVTDREGAWLLALWNLDDFKRSQEIARGEGDWALPAKPAASGGPPERIRAEFVEAMEVWDGERADRALVALLPRCDRAEVFELLWPFASRSFVNIGHKIIYTAQIERVLRRIDARHAEPALRSLVDGLLYQAGGKQTDAFERTRSFARKLPAAWLEGREAPERSRDLLVSLRTCDPAEAQELVVAAFADGLGPATVWDGLRLWGSEVFLRRTQSRPADSRAALLPVHAVTVVNAFGHAWRSTASAETKRVAILQAAGWVAQIRDGLALKDEGSIDALGGPTRNEKEDERSGLDECLENPTPDALCAHLQRDPSEREPLESRLAGLLARKGIEHHQHKYAAAVFEECDLVHPRWSPLLIACAAPYLPTQAEPETEICARSRKALRAAGIG